MIKHAVSANDVSRIMEIKKIAEVVAECGQTKIKDDSSGSSLDSSEETSTVINANCSCFCTIKDAIFKLFRCR